VVKRLMLAVVGVSQDLDFQSGSMTNFVVLELPDGGPFRAAVDDGVAQAIISAATSGLPPRQGMQGLPDEQAAMAQADLERLRSQADRQDAMRASVDEDGQPIMEFGGDGGQPADEDEPVHVSRPTAPRPTPEQVMAGRRIQPGMLDDMGNLTSVSGGGVDPGEVVVMGDEDGTESI